MSKYLEFLVVLGLLTLLSCKDEEVRKMPSFNELVGTWNLYQEDYHEVYPSGDTNYTWTNQRDIDYVFKNDSTFLRLAGNDTLFETNWKIEITEGIHYIRFENSSPDPEIFLFNDNELTLLNRGEIWVTDFSRYSYRYRRLDRVKNQ